MWNCKETGKQVHFDMLARAHLCPRRLCEFQKKRKIKRKKLFCRRPKRNEKGKKKWIKPMCVGSNKRKVGKEKEGSEGRYVIFGLLFLTLAAPYKKGAFLLKKKMGDSACGEAQAYSLQPRVFFFVCFLLFFVWLLVFNKV
jgi:hypothetical protein